MVKTTLSCLSDAALVNAVEQLARTERDTTVALVAHLAELGARKLYLAAGFSSLFMYCREVLALSEGEAYNRALAARAVRNFPVVLERLANRSVNLTTIGLLDKHLTSANHLDLLDASAGKSKRDVERLVAARFPQPAVPFSVHRMPAAPARGETRLPLAAVAEAGSTVATSPGASEPDSRNPTRVPSPCDRGAAAMEVAPPAMAGPVTPPPAPRPTRPATVLPIAEDRYSVRFTASADTWERLQAAQDLLRHSLPDGDVSEIVGRALTLLLEDLARTKFAATTRPRASKGTKPGSRDIPNGVKRIVWVRDCARCAFVGTSGRRCAERGRLEFHHVLPYGAGGEATVHNLELRCASHNLYESSLFYSPMREETGTVREAIPEWDVSPALSTSALQPSNCYR